MSTFHFCNKNVRSLNKTICNPNLLDNWDWHTLINQRDKALYTNAVSGTAQYTIDRFVLGDIGSIELLNRYIRLTKTNAQIGVVLEQRIENSILLIGKTVTCSIKTTDKIYIGSCLIPNGNFRNEVINIGNTGFIIDLFKSNGNPETRFRIASENGLPIGSYLDIEAVKLEVGNISTLLNDPPMNLGDELTRCQRHQITIGTVETPFPMVKLFPNAIGFFIPLPKTLRITPAVPSGLSVITTSNATQSGFTFSIGLRQNGLYVSADKNAHGLSSAFLVVPANTIFDANL